MTNDLKYKVTSPYMKTDIPMFRSGDTIEVTYKILEGDKSRTQIFKGLVIARKNSGISETFTIRKISHGVGVEKILPLHSPLITKIKVIKTGKVRRSKLYYMRSRIGKAALKIKDLAIEGVSSESPAESSE